MECPSCKQPLAEGATFCGYCGWRVGGGTLDKAVTNLAKVGKEAFHGGLRLVEKTAQAIEPVVEKGVKTVAAATKPAVEKAKPHVKKAVHEAARVTKKAVSKSAELAEKAARKVREKAR